MARDPAAAELATHDHLQGVIPPRICSASEQWLQQLAAEQATATR